MKVTHLTKIYGKRPLFTSLSFALDCGIIQLSGPSGCGKSTLIRLCLGLEKPSEGEVSYGDFNFGNKKSAEIAAFRAEKLGYCGEGSSLLYSFSLKENIAHLLPQIDQEKLKALAGKLSFNKLEKRLSRLSGGERHKAELIFAFLSEKETLFLDEPFSALDAKSKADLVGLINAYGQDHLVVLVNHDIGVVGLSLSLKVDIPSGKVETLLPLSEAKADSSQIPQPKKRSSAWFFFRDFIKSFRFELAIETLLIVAAFLSLLFGLSCYPSRNRVSAGRLAMDNDPLSSFTVAGSDVDQHREFDQYARGKSDTLCYFSSFNEGYRIGLVAVNGLSSDSTFFVDDRYGASPNSVLLSGTGLAIDAHYHLPEEKETYTLRCTREKKGYSLYTDALYFVSPGFIDAFFNAGGFPALTINGTAGAMPRFLYTFDGEISFTSWKKNEPLKTKIQAGSADVFLLPGVEAGAAVPFHSLDFGFVGPTLKASGKSNDADTVVLSPDYYRYLSYLLLEAGDPFNRGLLSAFNEEAALAFLEKFPGSEVIGVIHANYSYPESIGRLFLAAGAGLLVFYFLVVGFSFKGKRAYFRNAAFFLSLQGFSPRDKGGLLTLPFALQGLLAEGVGLLAYGIAFIPTVNAIIFQQDYRGSYLEGRFLEEYAMVKGPLPFVSFNWLSLLSLLFLLLVYGGMLFYFARHADSFKEKSKTKSR